MPEAPRLVVGDGDGNVFEIPELEMAGVGHLDPVSPAAADLIPLPPGSDLFELPGRLAIGRDPQSGEFVELEEYNGVRVRPVAAFMAPAYLHLLRAAYENEPGAPRLPLYCYAALGWTERGFVVPAARIDADVRQDYEQFDSKETADAADAMLTRYPDNRLVRHLVDNCVRRYNCAASRNFVLGRYECPLPTTPGCNAACVGCISEQPGEATIESPHDRIAFTPTPEEIVEFAVSHLESAERAVVSFGQGCEGEPLLSGRVLEEAILAIRKRTAKGMINVNTNASRPDVVERLCAAGLDSIRVSTNSLQKQPYEAYYRPRTYGFEDVIESLRVMQRHGRWRSLNYLVFPGLTDHPDEFDALKRVAADVELDMIQTRNLNIDPEWYCEELGLAGLSPAHLGMPRWLARLRDELPSVTLGYFNPPRTVAQRA